MNIVKYIFLVGLVLNGTAKAVSPTWSDYINQKSEPVYKVTQYLQQDDGSNLVVLNGGTQGGLMRGALLEAFRRAALTGSESTEPLWIRTGSIKITQLQEQTAIARVVEDQTELSKTFFPKFPNLMAGDLVVFKTVSLARKQTLLPQVSVGYHDIFIDPKAHPITFELKPDAVAVLKQLTQSFADSRVPLLMIEGYTDQNGSQQDNQVESYQRAMTVRQYMIDELGFHENRVVAIGYGESELTDTSMTPGHAQANRRIVIKPITKD